MKSTVFSELMSSVWPISFLAIKLVRGWHHSWLQLLTGGQVAAAPALPELKKKWFDIDTPFKQKKGLQIRSSKILSFNMSIREG